MWEIIRIVLTVVAIIVTASLVVALIAYGRMMTRMLSGGFKTVLKKKKHG